MGDRGAKYKFPKGKYNNRYHPIAADVAIPDDEVPREYILQQKPSTMYD